MKRPWRSVVARTVIEIIRAANSGRTPTAVSEWRGVCEHLCCDLTIVASRGHTKALLIDDVMMIRSADDDTQTGCRIAHEITEYLLVRNGHAAPFRFTSRLADSAERHRIALRVERAWRRYARRGAQCERACKTAH